MGDMRSKGRGCVGSRNAQARLNESTARAIMASKEPGVVLAVRHCVSESVISRIRSGKAWRHLLP
jgi:hypothetical protein